MIRFFFEILLFFSDDGANNRVDNLVLKPVKNNPNKMDGDQYCRCNPGERINEFNSVHEDWAEDRKWNLTCAGITIGEMCVSFTRGFCFLGHWGSQGINDFFFNSTKSSYLFELFFSHSKPNSQQIP